MEIIPSLYKFVVIGTGIKLASLVIFNKPGTIHTNYTNNHNASDTLILFGWTGANYNDIKNKHKTFEKIKNIKKIYTVVTPLPTTIFSIFGIKNTVVKLFDKCQVENDFDAPIHVLFYSGGGSMYYELVDKYFNNPNPGRSNLVKTYTFDSAPVPAKAKPFAQWIGGNFGYLASATSYIIFVTYMHFFDCCRLKFKNNAIFTNNNNIPSLFINGKHDRLVPKDNLELYKLTRPNSSFFDFDDSLHLEHDTKYPTEYLNLVEKHLE